MDDQVMNFHKQRMNSVKKATNEACTMSARKLVSALPWHLGKLQELQRWFVFQRLDASRSKIHAATLYSETLLLASTRSNSFR